MLSPDTHDFKHNGKMISETNELPIDDNDLKYHWL
jgi:hypothetical protein